MNLRDVTEQHAAEANLSRQAVQDPLTGLPNRRWFLDALGRAVARARRTRRGVAVLLIDVDHFKRVNDGLGHPAGDRLLVDLAERMTGPLRPEDTVARLGGDEFVILAEDLRHETDALAIAERLAQAATGPYRLGPALQAHVTLSDRRGHGRRRARRGRAARARGRRAVRGQAQGQEPDRGVRPGAAARAAAADARRARALPRDRRERAHPALAADRLRRRRRRSSPPRRWCAGSIPSAGCSARPSSCPSPSTRG